MVVWVAEPRVALRETAPVVESAVIPEIVGVSENCFGGDPPVTV